MIKISVIIPLYNQEKYISQCLQSILLQSLNEIEILVIDDGSTDSSLEIIKKIKEKDSRIKILYQNRKGAGAARNLGMSMASGEFIHFLDSDDWLEPHAYSTLIESQKEAPSEVLVFLYNKYDNKTGETRKIQLFPTTAHGKTYASANEYKSFFYRTSVVPWNKLFCRRFLERIAARFDEVMVGNDRTFYYLTISEAKSIHLLSDELINYRINNDQSLIGINRADHIDDLIASYHSTIKTLSQAETECADLAKTACIEDIILTFNRSNIKQKKNILHKVSEFLNIFPQPTHQHNQQKKPWSAKLEVLKTFTKTKKHLHENIIPIVMATNDNYAPYIFVTIHSLSKTLSPGSYCKIYIFHSGISEKYIAKAQSLQYENLEVYCIDVSATAEAQETYTRAHYSAEMYYRILIPELLDMYEKTIYLDCDLVVNDSITRLFDIDLQENLIAGVRNFCNHSMLNWINNSLKLDPNQYINTGVLLFNNEMFRASNAKERCFQLLKSRDFLACPDQDMINYACAGKIKIIDSGWNLQWHHTFKEADTHESSEPDLENAKKKKHIIHYTSGKKAWLYPLYEYASEFWQFARESATYSEISRINLNKKINQITTRLNEIKSQPYDRT